MKAKIMLDELSLMSFLRHHSGLSEDEQRSCLEKYNLFAREGTFCGNHEIISEIIGKKLSSAIVSLYKPSGLSGVKKSQKRGMNDVISCSG